MNSKIEKINVDNLNNKATNTSFNSSFSTKIDTIDLTNNLKDNHDVNYAEDVVKDLDYSKIVEDGFTPQGYTYIDGKLFVSAHYDSGYFGENGQQNSRVYIFDAETGKLLGDIVLNNKNHVGGVSYDTENGIMFVAGDNGNVETYDYKELMNGFEEPQFISDGNEIELRLDYENLTGKEREIAKNNYDAVIIPNNLNVRDEVSEGKDLFHKQDGMDTLYYHNGKLYSGTYARDGELVETSYGIVRDHNGNIIEVKDAETKVIGKVGAAVQGMAFYKKDGKTYLVTAASGMFVPSLVTVYEMTDDGIEKAGSKVIAREGLEGIYIDDYGNISGVYEEDKVFEEVQDDRPSDFQIGNVNDIKDIDDTYKVPNPDGSERTVDARFSLEQDGETWDNI